MIFPGLTSNDHALRIRQDEEELMARLLYEARLAQQQQMDLQHQQNAVVGADPYGQYKAAQPRKRLNFVWSLSKNTTTLLGPYDVATSGSVNWGNTATTCSWFLTYGHKYRIRQTGTINSVKLFFFSGSNTRKITGFYVDVWRDVGSNVYDYVTSSNDISPSFSSSNGIRTFNLEYPLNVKEGDFYGYHIYSDPPNLGYDFYAKTGVSSAGTYYFTHSVNAPSTSSFNWSSVSNNIPGAVFPIELLGPSPSFVFVGDSIIAGHPAHYSFIEPTNTTNTGSTIEYQLSTLASGFTYQNMGIGSQTTTNINSRFVQDVTNLSSSYVLLEGGVNDLAGAVSFNTFQSNWQNMLSSSVSNNITPITLLILPWTNGTNIQMTTRDTWNAWLKSATEQIGGIVIDASSYVGQFRAGGDTNNLWDIIPSLGDGSGVHFNANGHKAIAQAIYDTIQSL